ncbi:hypothetical protein OG203_08055 [Nocardia sp. NBC_01499]
MTRKAKDCNAVRRGRGVAGLHWYLQPWRLRAARSETHFAAEVLCAQWKG